MTMRPDNDSTNGQHEDAGLPPVQGYGNLAHDYDETRYTGEVNILKESFRRRALKDLLPVRAERALDVACGTGRGVLILRDVAPVVFGVDGTREMLQIARRKLQAANPDVCVCQANAALLPFASESFDLVSCLNFLHLFDDARKKTAFVREIGRVLRPGGVAVIEFDNALQGLIIGGIRKYFGRDIGYDWPWVIRGCFPSDVFTITGLRGSNLPGVWRFPMLRAMESAAARFPLNYLAARIFVRAERI
jgi:ubiquinone/menaquinone biosynthesis C-methylase UbiE